VSGIQKRIFLKPTIKRGSRPPFRFVAVSFPPALGQDAIAAMSFAAAIHLALTCLGIVIGFAAVIALVARWASSSKLRRAGHGDAQAQGVARILLTLPKVLVY
jgi:hypothetical protein